MTEASFEQNGRRILQRIARRYRRQGYATRVAPKPETLPSWLRPFDLDLIAVGKRDSVIVEVKSWPGAARDQLTELARIVEGHPDWRLDFVSEPDPERRLKEYEGALMTADQAASRRRDAERLAASGVFDAAFLLHWSALEAGLRREALRAGIDVRGMSAAALVEAARFEGLIDENAYRLLHDLAALRDRLSHGMTAPGIGPATVAALAEMNAALS